MVARGRPTFQLLESKYARNSRSPGLSTSPTARSFPSCRRTIPHLRNDANRQHDVFQNYSWHQGVDTAFVRPDAIRMVFVERKQMPAVLQDNSGSPAKIARTNLPVHQMTVSPTYPALGLKGGHVQPQVQVQIITNLIDLRDENSRINRRGAFQSSGRVKGGLGTGCSRSHSSRTEA
jgi:hypothetical protein